MKTQHLAGSQVVVCKIRQPPLLVSQALLSAILFHLPRVVLAIFLPIDLVPLAPLPRTLQADLPIHRIGSDLLSMIIAAALALACRLAANPLLRMIRSRLENLLTVGAAVILHQAAPEENGRGSFSLEVPLNLNAPAQKFSAIKTYRVLHHLRRMGCYCFSPPSTEVRSICLGSRNTTWLCGVVPSTKPADLSARNRDRRLLGCEALRNNTPSVIPVTRCSA